MDSFFILIIACKAFGKIKTQCISTHHSCTHTRRHTHNLLSQEWSIKVCEKASIKQSLLSWVLNSEWGDFTDWQAVNSKHTQ